MAEIIIIGAGASGMAAAIAASENPENHIKLIERQARAGRKLLSTGNGRCNLTNTAASTPVHYHGEKPDFAAAALKRFNPEMTLGFFESLGLMTATEYGGRVYPMSNQAASVLDVLRFGLEKENVELIAGTAVEKISREGKGFAVLCGEERLRCDKLIAACGGCAGSKLGGVTDGYRLLSELGHSRTALHPALTQLRTQADYPKALKGVRAEARLKITKKGKTLAENSGEVLFTDNGVSGTAVFEVSREASTAGEGAEIELDFFPNVGENELLKWLNARRELWAEKPANQILTGTVHNRLGQMLCKYARIGATVATGELTAQQLKSIVSAGKDFKLAITGVSGFESAQVTAGGMKTGEFNPETMESLLVPGLFACGELLDIDGDCGGYNLQWAWASGMLAGRSCN